MQQSNVVDQLADPSENYPVNKKESYGGSRKIFIARTTRNNFNSVTTSAQ